MSQGYLTASDAFIAIDRITGCNGAEEAGAVPEYWSPPPNFEAQKFKKPSAKRLSKKGKEGSR